MPKELTTIAHEFAVVHDGTSVRHYDELNAAESYEYDGLAFTTLIKPEGELLCTFATVNDVHFGEPNCGYLAGAVAGPILQMPVGADPHPELMNRAAISEMQARDLSAVIVKGDLTHTGTQAEYDAFCRAYVGAFGDRLFHVRGNHDSYEFQNYAAGDQAISLTGICIALLDTAIPGQTTGTITDDQIAWLDDLATHSAVPIIVMGHHQQWIEGKRSDDYFGLHPDASDALTAVVARRTNILAYTAGHTHRHRVRMMANTNVPSIEIGCVKDFPGTWAEYRVYEGGVTQIVHRMSSPDALAWSEQCRHLYKDAGVDYTAYGLGRLQDRCFNIAQR